MSQYARLMLITEDGREVTPALRRAMHLARATGAELQIVVFCNEPTIDSLRNVDPDVMEVCRQGWLAEQGRALQALVEPLAGEGVRIRVETVWDPPFADVVLARIAADMPDMVLKDAHPEPLIRRLMLGSLDWQLAELSPVPVLFVNTRAGQLPTRVIAAVDGAGASPGALNGEVIRATLSLAMQCDAEARLVHVSNCLPPVSEGMLLGDSGDGYRAVVRADQETFHALAERFAVPRERRHEFTGPVPHALAEFAHDSAGDVLVIGAAHRTGVERIFLGRQADAILRRVHCDVLVVKPRGFREAGATRAA